jgi:hypothetical protein
VTPSRSATSRPTPPTAIAATETPLGARRSHGCASAHLDQERHGTARGRGVAAERDPPAQEAVGGLPLGGDRLAGIVARFAQRGDRPVEVVAARDPVHEARPDGDRVAQRRRVEIEPAGARRAPELADRWR